MVLLQTRECLEKFITDAIFTKSSRKNHSTEVLFAFKAETQSLKLSGVWPHLNGVALLAGFGCMQSSLCLSAGLAA